MVGEGAGIRVRRVPLGPRPDLQDAAPASAVVNIYLLASRRAFGVGYPSK
jgi:hypothetical protein